MLAGKVTNLTSLWLGGVTLRLLTSLVGVKVSQSGGAGAVGGNGQGVDVVRVGTLDAVELTLKVDRDINTGSVLSSSEGDLSLNGSLLVKNDLVDFANGVVVDDGSIAELAGDTVGGVLLGQSSGGQGGDDNRLEKHLCNVRKLCKERKTKMGGAK